MPDKIPSPQRGPRVPEIGGQETAKLQGMEVEALGKASEQVASPGHMTPISKDEKVETMTSEIPELPKLSEMIGEETRGSLVKNQQAKAMAEALDIYAADRYRKKVVKAVKKGFDSANAPLNAEEKALLAKKVEQQCYKKFHDALLYFVTIDARKGEESPLDRMASLFEHLPFPDSDLERESFEAAMAGFAQELVKKAFDQHLDNPEQYVSHGFDHSINVANYTRDIMRLVPEIVDATSTKYQLSEGESRFVLETIALLHDTGYPFVGHRSKSVHGISGADSVLVLRDAFDQLITSPDVDKESLFNDFRNSILFHSADKIEHSFTTKIVSTLGTFLADHENVVQVLSNFYDPDKNPSHQPRYVTEIYVQNPEMRSEIEQSLAAARFDLEEKLDREVALPKVILHEGLFKGRFADLEYSKDKLLGLEFTTTDLLHSPLNLIRVVDNMDMSRTRLSPIQAQAAFREIYCRLGDQKELSHVTMALEHLEREVDRQLKSVGDKEKAQLSDEIQKLIQKTLSELMKGLQSKASEDHLIQRVLSKLTADKINGIQNPTDARNVWTGILIDSVLEDERYSDLASETQEEIRRIGRMLSSFDLRHFGGCEAVKNVQLIGIASENGTIPSVVITVDRDLYDELNRVKVKESSPTYEGIIQTATVGVGEYQIWRASDAYRSILLGELNLQLRIVDESGQPVSSSIQL